MFTKIAVVAAIALFSNATRLSTSSTDLSENFGSLDFFDFFNDPEAQKAAEKARKACFAKKQELVKARQTAF